MSQISQENTCVGTLRIQKSSPLNYRKAYFAKTVWSTIAIYFAGKLSQQTLKRCKNKRDIHAPENKKTLQGFLGYTNVSFTRITK